MPRPLKASLVILILLIVLCAGGWWWLFLRRETNRWTESIPLADGATARARFEHSARVYWDFGHVGGIGGGDDRYQLQVSAGGNNYVWAGGDERPIVLALHDRLLFMAVFDRSDVSRIRFRYYRSDPAYRLQEIPPAEFPREHALQNAWLQPKDAGILAAMDPQDFWFRDSLTARMWLHLARGIEYYEGRRSAAEPSPEFLADYKIRYLGLTAVLR